MQHFCNLYIDARAKHISYLCAEIFPLAWKRIGHRQDDRYRRISISVCVWERERELTWMLGIDFWNEQCVREWMKFLNMQDLSLCVSVFVQDQWFPKSVPRTTGGPRNLLKWSANPYKNQYFVLCGALKYFKWFAYQKSLGTIVLDS